MKPGATFSERWQSGRMRRIRNPVYGIAVTWVRIPPSPPETRTPLVGVLRFWRSGGVDEPTGFDKFVWNKFGQPKAGSERSEGRGAWMRRAIPPSPPETRTPLVGVLRFWRSGGVDGPTGFDKFVWNKFGQPKAGPERSEGRGAWMRR